MTLANAKSLAADLLAQGMCVTIMPRSDSDFQVDAKALSGTIDLKLLASLAQKYTVSAPITVASFL